MTIKYLSDSTLCIEDICLLGKVYEFLEDLKQEYPGFEAWYHKKIIPGVIAGKRLVLLIMDGKAICAVAILKDDGEKKICTLRVGEKYQRKGYGRFLFEQSISLLNTKHPMITLPLKRFREYKNLLKNFDFKLNGIYPQRYVQSDAELSFNGELEMGSRITLLSNVAVL